VEPRKELIDVLKLQVRVHCPTTRACATNRSAKRVKLTPDSSTLGVELINSRLTLLKSMLLTNHRQIKSILGWLIALTKMSPHVSNSRKTHKLRGKLWQNTRSENSCSMSILIHPLSVGCQIQPIGLKGTSVLLKL
jgi:hypothetical protein